MTTDKSRADALTDAEIWHMWNSIDHNISATRPILFARALLAASPVEQPAAASIDEVTCARMGHGIVSIADCFSPELQEPGIIFMELPEQRDIGLDTGDVFPEGSRAPADKTLAYVSFANPEAIDQTIGVLQRIKAKHFPAPALADERAAFEAWWTRDVPAEHKASACALLKQFGDGYAANKRCAEAWEVWQARASSATETGAEGAKPFGWVQSKGGNYFTRNESSAKRIGGLVPVYLAPTQTGEPVAFACLTPSGKVAFFDGKPMLSTVQNNCFPTALYAVPQPPAQADAREGLTADERSTINRAISEVELCCQFSLADELRTLLAAHPGQPEPRAEVTGESFGDQALAILEELVRMRYEKCRIVCQDNISAVTFQSARALLAARAGEAS